MAGIKRCVQAFFNDNNSLYCLNCDKNDALNYREFHRDLDQFNRFQCYKCLQNVGVFIVNSVDCQYCLKENESDGENLNIPMLRRDEFDEIIESVASINVSQETPTQKFNKIEDRKRRRVDELYAARSRPRYDNEYLGTYGLNSEYEFTDQDIEDIRFEEVLIENNLQNENTEIIIDDFNNLGESSTTNARGRQAHINIWIELVEEAIEGRIKTFRIYNARHKDPKRFLEECMVQFNTSISRLLIDFPSVKLGGNLKCHFRKMDQDFVIEEPKYFCTSVAVLTITHNLNEWFIEYIMSKTLEYLDDFQEVGSGWALINIDYLELRVHKYSVLNGGSHIDLPPVIRNRRACLSVMNTDNQCFKYAILAGLYYNPEHDGKRHSRPNRENNNTLVKYYKDYENKLNMTGISYPVKIHEIKKFEKQNMSLDVKGKVSNISVNIYILKMDKNRDLIVGPIHISDQRRKGSHHVNILLHHDYDLYETESDELAAVLKDSTVGNSNIRD